MSIIILDFGSGNSCLNDKKIVKKMYDELKKVDTGKHLIICKWQLFKEAGKNIPLDRDIFDYAYKYGNQLGYKVTASVFDKESLEFLLQYDVPMIKIANRPELRWLIGEAPRKIPVYVSYGEPEIFKTLEYKDRVVRLLCVSNYPTTLEEYESAFGGEANLLIYANHESYGISDHTTNFELWDKYNPQIIEMHYKLPESKGLDTGLFARTPRILAKIL